MAGEQQKPQPPQLPTEHSEPQAVIGTTLIYAEAKTGKSTQALAMFPDALVAETEGPQHHLRRKAFPVASWQDFLTMGWALQEGQKDNYEAAIIDTADALALMCADFSLRRLAGGAAQNQGRAAAKNFVHASDYEYGKGYAAISDEFSLRVGKIMALMPNTVIVCHADTKTLKNEAGQERHVIVPDLAPKGIRRFLEDTVSHIFYARWEADPESGENRAVLRTRNGPNWTAGARLPVGVEPLPDPMPFDGALLRRELEARLSPPKPKKAKKARKPAEGENGAQEPQNGAQAPESSGEPQDGPRSDEELAAEAQGQLA
jgi:hypothetical protein